MKQLRIHPLLVDLVQSSILTFDRMVFDQRDRCPACGGPLSGYDTRARQFAIMLREGKHYSVQVFVKRFTCRECRVICSADEPFYPDTRSGSLIVDLCRTLAKTMPFHRAAVYLAQMGIVVDRGTIRKYSRQSLPEIPMTDLFGIRLPLSVVSLASLATSAGEGSPVAGAEALGACGLPSAYRAAPHFPLFPEKRDERYEQEGDEERQPQYPEDRGQQQ
jgi:hypothetical protein